MFKKIRIRILSAIVTLSLSAAVIGVEPASTWLWYQPEIPEHLRGR